MTKFSLIFSPRSAPVIAPAKVAAATAAAFTAAFTAAAAFKAAAAALTAALTAAATATAAEVRIPIAGREVAKVGPVVHLWFRYYPFNGHNRRLLNTLSEFTWYEFFQLIAWLASLAASTNCGSAMRCIHIFQYGYFPWFWLFNTFSEDTWLRLLQHIAFFARYAT